MNTITKNIEITDKMIEDILCSAFEGGITYWANSVSIPDQKDAKKLKGCWKHEYLTKTNKKDAVLIIHDRFTLSKRPMTKQSILTALQSMTQKQMGCTKALRNILDGYWDIYDADIVVQIACFGDVIYG